MRVLMFVPQYPYPVVGGLEKQAHELSKALVRQHVSVQVLSGKIQPDQPDEETVEGIRVVRLPWSRRKVLRFLLAPWHIAHALWIRSARFDVIHLHQYSWVGLYVILLSKLLGKPILTKLPNVGDFGLPGLRRKFLGLLRQRILLLSDAIVAMSRESLRELQDAGYPKERILATPNGIDLHADKGSDTLDREPGVVRVVFVGRLSEQKCVDLLLDAWASVAKTGATKAALEIWGVGPLEAELKTKSDLLGLDQSVRFVGHVDDVRVKLRSMDVFVLTSRVEGNSNAVLEAMAAGLPVVATPVGGTPMLVGPEGRDFLCPVGNSEMTGQVLRTLIEDPDMRSSLGVMMRRRAERYFDIGCVASTYATAYSLLARKQRELVHTVWSPVIQDDDP